MAQTTSLLKDLSEIVTKFPEHYQDFIRCYIICSFMLYPTFFLFSSSFESYTLYTQLLLVVGGSAIYTAIFIPLFVILIGKAGMNCPPFILSLFLGYTIFKFQYELGISNEARFFMNLLVVSTIAGYIIVFLKWCGDSIYKKIKKRKK